MAVVLFPLTEYITSFLKNVWMHIAYVFYKFSGLPCECSLNFFPLPFLVTLERNENTERGGGGDMLNTETAI
jgi:hypothetical protein